MAKEEVKNHEALKVEDKSKEEANDESLATTAPRKRVVRRKKTEE